MGNPRPIGFAWIFKNNKSSPLILFVIYCGIATNDLAMFLAAEIGLHITTFQGFKLIQMHGDKMDSKWSGKIAIQHRF